MFIPLPRSAVVTAASVASEVGVGVGVGTEVGAGVGVAASLEQPAARITIVEARISRLATLARTLLFLYFLARAVPPPGHEGRPHYRTTLSVLKQPAAQQRFVSKTMSYQWK